MQFLGIILDHRFDSQHQRTIEELGKHKIPSETESLQSMILGKIPSFGQNDVTRFPLEFCEFIIFLWGACMKEKYVGHPFSFHASQLLKVYSLLLFTSSSTY